MIFDFDKLLETWKITKILKKLPMNFSENSFDVLIINECFK